MPPPTIATRAPFLPVARAAPRERRRASEHDRGADDAAALDELPPRDRPFGLPLAELGGPDSQRLRLTVLAGQTLQRTHQRCPCHCSLSSPCASE